MSGATPITVGGLNHYFGTGEARKQAIFDINLSIAKGFKPLEDEQVIGTLAKCQGVAASGKFETYKRPA